MDDIPASGISTALHLMQSPPGHQDHLHLYPQSLPQPVPGDQFPGENLYQKMHRFSCKAYNINKGMMIFIPSVL